MEQALMRVSRTYSIILCLYFFLVGFLEHGFYGLLALLSGLQLCIGALLYLLVPFHLCIYLVLLLNGSDDGLDVKQLALAPMVQVEVRILEAVRHLLRSLLEFVGRMCWIGWSIALFSLLAFLLLLC